MNYEERLWLDLLHLDQKHSYLMDDDISKKKAIGTKNV